MSTVDLSWRAWWWAGPIVLAQASFFLRYELSPAPDPEHGGGWFLVGPDLLLANLMIDDFCEWATCL